MADSRTVADIASRAFALLGTGRQTAPVTAHNPGFSVKGLLGLLLSGRQRCR